MTEKLHNLFLQAKECDDKKDWDGAIRYYSEIIDLPEDQISKENRAIALYTRGIAFAKKGDLDAALRDFDQAITLKPDFAEALNSRGTVFTKKDDLDRAFRDFEHALKIKPDFAKALNNRGLTFAKKGDLDAALRDYDNALKSEPDYAEVLNNRGAAFAKKGDLDAALRDFEHAIEIKPDYVEAFHNRAIAIVQIDAQKVGEKYQKEHEEQLRQLKESHDQALRQVTDPVEIIKSYEGREKTYNDQISELDSKIENRTSWLFGVLIVGFLTIAVVVFEVWRRLAFGSSDCEMPNCSAHGVVIVNCCPTDRGEVSFAGLFAIAPLTLVLFTACFPLIAHLFNLRKEKRRLQVCVEDYFRKQTLVRYTLVAKDEHKQQLIATTHAHFATRSTAEFLAGWKPESEENPNPLTDAIGKAIRDAKDAASRKPTEKSPS